MAVDVKPLAVEHKGPDSFSGHHEGERNYEDSAMSSPIDLADAAVNAMVTGGVGKPRGGGETSITKWIRLLQVLIAAAR